MVEPRIVILFFSRGFAKNVDHVPRSSSYAHCKIAVRWKKARVETKGRYYLALEEGNTWWVIVSTPYPIPLAATRSMEKARAAHGKQQRFSL
jgi:hypothetical protein